MLLRIRQSLHNRHRNAAFALHFHSSTIAHLQQNAAKELSDDEYFAELGRRPTERVLRLADEMISLSVLEVSDVADLLKRKLKISNMPMMGYGMGPGMSMQAAGAPQAEEKKPEKMTFDVKLEKYEAAAKIKIIKEIRTFTSLGLKEAKELVEKIPATVKTGVSKEEASDIVAKLKALGATVVME